jgi:hypothetical protein
MSSQISMDDLRNTILSYYKKKQDEPSTYDMILSKLNSFMNMSEKQYSNWFDESIADTISDTSRTTGIPKYKPLGLDEMYYYDPSKIFQVK